MTRRNRRYEREYEARRYEQPPEDWSMFIIGSCVTAVLAVVIVLLVTLTPTPGERLREHVNSVKEAQYREMMEQERERRYGRVMYDDLYIGAP